MPALVIFWKFTTRPFGGDDLHILCLLLSCYRLIQAACLAPLFVHAYFVIVGAKNVLVDGVPPWCDHYDASALELLFVEDVALLSGSTSRGVDADAVAKFKRINFLPIFVAAAVVHLAADATWICMVWSASSLGTPTETAQRDRYLRLYPLFILVFSIIRITTLREDNYGCGDGKLEVVPDEDAGIWHFFLCTLLVTYALELLFIPATVVNQIMHTLRAKSLLVRYRRHDITAKRFENCVGLALKMLQCATCTSRIDFQNKGELEEFSHHFLQLLNYKTKLFIVLSDMYVGMYMLSRVQAERKADAIKKMLMEDEQKKTGHQMSQAGSVMGGFSPSSLRAAFRASGRNSVPVLCAKFDSVFEIGEREPLRPNTADEALMRDAATFSKYAQVIYSRLKKLVVEEFMIQHEVVPFERDPEKLFRRDFVLSSIGCEHATLAYASFVSGIIETPYAILIDDEVKGIVITVRGTFSLDDVVADLQYNPVSLEKTGKVCGFLGGNHFCHKGLLTRAKWLYNDIKKSQTLKTLYSEQSPFNTYSLILCGHSLGAGCASLLSIMLRPSFPALRCWAYCPPGAVVDGRMAQICEDFITCIVRQDDLIPRTSQHSFEILRKELLDIITRIKVPKIKKPCPDCSVTARNAKVLRPMEEVPHNTEFYRQLERFRAERAEHVLRSHIRDRNLYIAGKIVHLMDTKGDNSDYKAYVPYWADRQHDFNQWVISKRMGTDHSMDELVHVLNNVHLRDDDVGHSISIAYCNSVNISEKDEDFDHIRLFMCCSNPFGRLPIILSIATLISVAISVTSMTRCDFLSRDYQGVDFYMGLFRYTLLTCKEGSCSSLGDVIPSEYCIPYPYEDYNWRMRVRRRTWHMITCTLLLASCFQGLVLLVNKSGLCYPIYLDDIDETIESECHPSAGATEAAIACCLYFSVAIGSGHSARELNRNN